MTKALMDHLTVTDILPGATAEAVAAMAGLRLTLADWPPDWPPLVTAAADNCGLLWFVYACPDCGETHYAPVERVASEA